MCVLIAASNNQAYEMYVAGYKFLVLNNLFMNHWGLQVVFNSNHCIALSEGWRGGLGTHKSDNVIYVPPPNGK